jgi:glycosyltransferase involved in cell wall biosynthesis
MVRCGIDARAVPAVSDRAFDTPAGISVLRLVSVGILAPWRRLEDAIRAVAVARQRGCDCRYEIIGSDRFWPSYGALLRQLVQELGLRDVIDLRFESIAEPDLEAAYARADAAVFPNERQAWGLAQLEAMVRGVPAIVSRGAGVSEVLDDGRHALLVDPRRPDQIADAIGRLAADPSLRNMLAERGRALVLESYTSAHYARQMRDVFRSCVTTRV